MRRRDRAAWHHAVSARRAKAQAYSPRVIGDHQRFTLLWAFSAAAVMLVATIVFGIVPVVGSPS